MSEMSNRVVTAICGTVCCDDGCVTTGKLCERLMRVVFAAIREPTLEMRKAGADVFYGITFDLVGSLGIDRAKACHKAMIAAAEADAP